jgi:hypothetical protein
MAVPSSGSLSMRGLAREKIFDDYGGNGVTNNDISLQALAIGGLPYDPTNTNSPSYPNATAPHGMGEWYSYDHDACTIPSTPVLSYVSRTSTSITLSWPAASGAVSYTLYWKPSGGSTPATITSVTSPYTKTGIAPSTTYEFYLKAVNACGLSNQSNTITQATAAAVVNPEIYWSNTVNGGGINARLYIVDDGSSVVNNYKYGDGDYSGYWDSSEGNTVNTYLYAYGGYSNHNLYVVDSVDGYVGSDYGSYEFEFDVGENDMSVYAYTY